MVLASIRFGGCAIGGSWFSSLPYPVTRVDRLRRHDGLDHLQGKVISAPLEQAAAVAQQQRRHVQPEFVCV